MKDGRKVDNSLIREPKSSPKASESGPRRLQVPADREGQRLDNFLLSQLAVPKSLIYRLLRKGAIRVNGKRSKPADRLQGGEEIRLPMLIQEQRQPGEVPKPVLEIAGTIGLYEDSDFLIVDKPSGWAAHSGSGLDWGLIEVMRQARGEPTLELAHRLDRATSGVSILCRSRQGLKSFHDALRDNKVEKKYLALLCNAESRSAWTADLPLLKGSGKGNQPQVTVDNAGQGAVSHFKVLEHFNNATLVEVTIETGRMHQIRVHAKATSSALAGDDRYGDKAEVKLFRELGLRRLFLHCSSMGFIGPDADITAHAPLPDDLRAVVDRLY